MQEEIKLICEENDYKDPLELLVALSNGRDLRKASAVFMWLEAFEEEFPDELPDAADWENLKGLIKSEGRFAPVPIKESASAQKTILEYMHSKKKAIELNITNGEAAVKPLTRKDVRLFKRKFEGLV